MRLIAVIAVSAALCATSACGLKDNLYLPAPKPSAAARQPAPVEPSTRKEDESTTGAKPAPPAQ